MSDTETVSDTETTVSDTEATPAPPKKKTRRGSRGGKNRRKRVAAAAAATDGGAPAVEPVAEAPPTVTIHVPAEDLGTETNGAAPVKKKTRRGSRGGKNRRKKPAGRRARTAATRSAQLTWSPTSSEGPKSLTPTATSRCPSGATT